MINTDGSKGVNLSKTQPNEPKGVNLEKTQANESKGINLEKAQQQPSLNNTFDTFEAKFNNAAEKVSNVVENLFESATKAVNNIVGNTTEIPYSNEPNGINLEKTQPNEFSGINLTNVQQQSSLNDTFNTFEATFNEATEKVSNIVENLVGNATEVVNNIVGNATEKVYNIVEKAIDGNGFSSLNQDTPSTGEKNEYINVVAHNTRVVEENETTVLDKENTAEENATVVLNKDNIAEENTTIVLNKDNIAEENTSVVLSKDNIAEENTAVVLSKDNIAEENVTTVLDSDNEENEASIQENVSEEDIVKPLSNEAVTTHTANLWKYLPVSDNEPEPAPEYIYRECKFPASKVIASRVRGKKHKHDGTNCDDWYEVANYNDITFVAVADGAGSKRFSRIGARESCRSSIGFLVNTFEEQLKNNPDLYKNLMLDLTETKCIEACSQVAGIVQQAVIKAYEAVEASFYSRLIDTEYSKALNRELRFKDFSATLLIAVIIPVNKETKENLVVTCQIGDGTIALINSKGEFKDSLKLMGEADSGEFSGETEFLTSPKMKNIETLQNRTRISRGIVDTILVMSDGVADDYFPNETEMRRLYFDLVVNGIIDSKKSVSQDCLPVEQMRLFKKIPDPLVYPWVNDQNVKIALQYTKRISEITGLSLEDIWQDDTVLALAKLELSEQNKIEDRSERLKVWLDNYVERGSFDDRTLVVVQM